MAKTIKELYSEGIVSIKTDDETTYIRFFNEGVDTNAFRWLKTEAIEWIKIIRSHKNYVGKEDLHELILIPWIKTFFNLTDDDLDKIPGNKLEEIEMQKIMDESIEDLRKVLIKVFILKNACYKMRLLG